MDKIIKVENIVDELSDIDNILHTNFKTSYLYVMKKGSNHIRVKTIKLIIL